MSTIIKSNDFTQVVMDRVKSDQTFKCGRSYADLLIWTRLCAPLTNSEVFSLLPVVLRNVWADEDTSIMLFDRGAQKPERFHVQSLAANLVCFRRTDQQNDEIVYLKEQLAHLSNQFNSLSYTIFDAVERLVALEEENQSLKLQLATNGMISSASSVGVLPPIENKVAFIPMRFEHQKPLTCQIFANPADASHPLFVL
jgi:hypothetical protein